MPWALLNDPVRLNWISSGPTVMLLQVLCESQRTMNCGDPLFWTETVLLAAYAGADTAAIRPAASRLVATIPEKIKPLRISVPFRRGRRILEFNLPASRAR